MKLVLDKMGAWVAAGKSWLPCPPTGFRGPNMLLGRWFGRWTTGKQVPAFMWAGSPCSSWRMALLI